MPTLTETPSKLLVIQLKRAGDIIVTTPVLPALKAVLPQATIDFLADRPFAPLLANNPHLGTVHLYDRKSPWNTVKALHAAKYDLILDFQSSPRSILCGLFSGAKYRAGYRVTFWGRFLSHAMKRPGGGLSVTEGKMNLLRTLFPDIGPAGDRRIFLSKEEQGWAASLMGQSEGAKQAVGLIPTHRRASRKWTGSSFRELASMYIAKGIPVWWFWGPGEEEEVAKLASQTPKSRMIPKTSLREMAALLEQCRLVVSNDNGPMHLAEAVGTPTLTIYGPTDPLAWNPGGPKHLALSVAGLPCLGCNLNACPFGHECMTQLSPQKVWKEAEKLWA